jgi:hypothetical protein
LGAFSWYFSGNQLVQMSGGSRMWQSASTIWYFDTGILLDFPGEAPGRTTIEDPRVG